jgi:hypothetical protein
MNHSKDHHSVKESSNLIYGMRSQRQIDMTGTSLEKKLWNSVQETHYWLLQCQLLQPHK